MQTWIGIAACVLLSACATYASELQKAQSAYEDARYERVITWLDELETHSPELDRGDRAKLYYLRGMSEFRLGRKTNARHYLALAREASVDGAGFSREWKRTLDRTLDAVDADFFEENAEVLRH